MKTATIATALLILVSIPAAAEEGGFQDALLDKLAGSWVMEGTIGGDDTVHDLVAEWVLDHYYLRFHEVARETDPDGTPLYEAIVFIGWDEPSSRYACLWLDSTGGGGLTAEGIGYAKPDGDDMPFVFDTDAYGVIYTTFKYIRKSDTWELTIDVEKEKKRSRFAQVVLTRRQSSKPGGSKLPQRSSKAR